MAPKREKQAPLPPYFVQERLYRKIANVLEGRIASGEFSSGDRLPTERELAEHYRMSRTCVREALLALEIAGLVSIRVGSGVYVLPPSAPSDPALIGNDELAGPTEIVAARLMFEPEIAAEAAARATPELTTELEDSIELMRREHRRAAEAEEGDRAFHHAIAALTGNDIAQKVMQTVWQSMDEPMWQSLQRHIRTPICRLQWIEDHEQILDAIRSGSRRKARAAMRHHLKNVQDRLNDFRT